MQLHFQVVAGHALGVERRSQVIALCTDAYEEDFSEEFDRLDAPIHVLARLDGVLVAHAAWVPRELRVGVDRKPLSCAYVEAVATAGRWQRQGLGTQVLRALPPLLGDFDIAALSPSEPGFYARSGWERWRGPLSFLREGRRVATPDEEVMIHRLPRTPIDVSLTDALETDWRPGDVW